MYSKLESIEEKILMINELYKKIEDVKNDDNILSEDNDKKNRILNNASKVYNKLLDNYKYEYLEQYEDNNEEWEKKYDYKHFNNLADREDKVFDIKKLIHNIGLYERISEFFNNTKDEYLNDEGIQIKRFLNKIDRGAINNKKYLQDEFKKLKQKINNQRLRDDQIKNLELTIFGHDYEELKYEESIAERVKTRRQTKGTGLKILTPQQMNARLPVSLAQLYAGNNSQKLKNEIRQLLYSLYRSKKISKTVYKNLIATI